jgi:hypothetical protein
MKLTHIAACGAALVCAVGLIGVGPASAKVPTFAAKILGPVHIDETDPSVAHVNAKYVCDTPEDAQWHLWVSLKQNATHTQDPLLEQEGSSAVAATWLQSHPGDFTCDGAWHTQMFTIDTLEQGFGTAGKGDGWVQFCLIDFADPSFTRAVIIQDWGAVR